MKRGKWTMTGFIVVVAAIFAIIANGKTIFGNNQDPFQLFICDNEGFPVMNIVLEIQNESYYINKKGKIHASTSWIGQTATIHDVNTWQLLKTVTINRNKNQQLVTIILEYSNKAKGLITEHNAVNLN